MVTVTSPAAAGDVQVNLEFAKVVYIGIYEQVLKNFSTISNVLAMTIDIVSACRAALTPDENFIKKSDIVDRSAVKILNHLDRNSEREVKGFSSEEFVENLLNEGSVVPCDETSDSFNNNMKLPPYYDEEIFKKGQDFFHRNIFGIFFSKLLGLIALLTLSASLKILIMTNKSSTEMSAYKRYVSTIFHMCVWYDEDFKPGSRFNICRESVTETKEICNLLIEKVFHPALEKSGEDFDKMSKALINGMWVMNPMLAYDVFLIYLHMALENTNSPENRTDFKKTEYLCQNTILRH
ncbi:hypothetical protein NQ314_009400 [Rhamnusium bicolor]|uniref:Uncharacterized protein n=1 Tax=Rhamnusium bicolor TaxID=1586634 RepID=A0AAV8XZY3_9CUCU|nr:hypothetical protein NQ314_009400 [Rhamnusium bicolor]